MSLFYVNQLLYVVFSDDLGPGLACQDQHLFPVAIDVQLSCAHDGCQRAIYLQGLPDGVIAAIRLKQFLL